MTTAYNAWSIRRRGDRMLGKNDPARNFGIVSWTSPACVAEQPRTRPVAFSGAGLGALVVAGADRRSGFGVDQLLHATRTHSRMKSVPSPVRNTSASLDKADWDKAIGEVSFDEYLAVHIENLAGGHLQSGRRAVTPNPTTPGGAVRRLGSVPGCVCWLPSGPVQASLVLAASRDPEALRSSASLCGRHLRPHRGGTRGAE